MAPDPTTIRSRAFHPRRPTGAAGPLSAALALLLAGCPQADDPRPSDGPPSVDTAAPGAPEREDVTLGESCTNDRHGFRIDYPSGWQVNEGDGLPGCSAFDPDDVGMPAASEVPRSIAVVVHRERVPFERVTDFASDRTVEALSRRATTVAGRRAVVAELEHTGEGLYSPGERQYTYYVDLDSTTIIAATHGVEDADPPSYEERRRILDAMMESLRLQD